MTLMPNRTPSNVLTSALIEPDVALDQEGVRAAYRTRWSENNAAEIIDEARRRSGWRSLGSRGVAAVARRIVFRVAPDVGDRAAGSAIRGANSIAQLVREAREARVADADGQS